MKLLHPNMKQKLTAYLHLSLKKILLQIFNVINSVKFHYTKLNNVFVI